MAQFAVTQVLGSGGVPFAAGIRDLFVWTTASGPVLYAATLTGGGVSAFAFRSDGTIAGLGGVAYPAYLAAGLPPDMAVATVAGQPSLIVSGLSERVLRLGADGVPLGWTDPGGWDGTPGHVEAVSLWGATRLLSGGPDPGVSVLSPASGYALVASVPGLAASGFAQTADGTLFAISAAADTLVHLVPGAFGTLEPRQVVGALDGLGWSGPSSVIAAEMAGTPYLVVAAAGSSSLTVLSFDGEAFRIHDHVIDDRNTRFEAVTDLSGLSVNGRTLIAASGADDGITLFELLPNGRLVRLQAIEDTVSLTLANPTAVSLSQSGGRIHLVAASEGDPGLTVFTRPSATLAAPILGSVSADTLTGGAADDLIVGGAGDDRLSGGAGDDVLHDGDGADSMSGGAGADLFVLASDGVPDRIEDFDPALDRLDLSLWGGLYAVAALSILPVSGGAVITYGDERLEIATASGAPLGPGDLTEATAIGLTRVPLSPIGRDLAGGPGPDTLFGADGNDRLSGLGGDDTLNGLGGDDALIGGAGRDTLDGGSGRDRLSGGTEGDGLAGGPGGDLLMGGAGGDAIDGGDGADVLSGGSGDDRLDGGEGNDVLRGGSGNDRLWGGPGADSLWGGTGDDTLSGDAGDDLLDGGSGADTLTGGPGADVFVFRDGAGADRIADFDPAGGDRIDLAGLSAFRDWGALGPALASEAGGTVIDAGAGDRLFLEGVAPADLGPDVFWF